MQKQASKQPAASQPPAKKLSKSDIKLSFKLSAEDSNAEIVNVEQSVVIPSLKEPLFLPDAYLQVEQMLNLIALEPFKRILKTYFNGLLRTHQASMSMGSPIKDAKILVETAKVEPEDGDNLIDPLQKLDEQGVTGDTSNVNPEEHYNLEVEEIAEEQPAKK